MLGLEVEESLSFMKRVCPFTEIDAIAWRASTMGGGQFEGPKERLSFSIIYFLLVPLGCIFTGAVTAVLSEIFSFFGLRVSPDRLRKPRTDSHAALTAAAASNVPFRTSIRTLSHFATLHLNHYL